jgi:hypothetical protein
VKIRPTPSELVNSTTPILHCCETWHVLASAGRVIANRPEQPETWAAIERMETDLLRPLEKHFGVVALTYGFAGRELVKEVETRAAEGGWLPNISPKGDQHAGYELNTLGKRICKHDGIAVDLRVPGTPASTVYAWVMKHLPFDRLYYYADQPNADQRAFHLSWAPQPLGQVVEMWTTDAGQLMPKVITRGRGG